MRKKKFVLMSLSVILLVALGLGMVSCHAGSGDPNETTAATETTGVTTAGTTEATVSESAEASTAATTAATEITTAPTEAATVATVAVTEPVTQPDQTGGETTPAVDPSEATKETAPDLTVATEPATKPTEAVKPTQPMATEPTTKPTEPKQTEATTAPTTKPTEATKPAHTHSYTAKVIKAATCTNAGTKTFSCSCGDTYTESIQATGHSYTSKVVAPTTSVKGYTQYTCSKCGNSYKDNYTDKLPATTTAPTTAPTTKPTEATKPAHKHSYTAKVTKAATCTVAGTKTFTCSCGDSYTESIKATGHSYTSKVTAATCTAQGYTTHTCSSCGYSTKDSYTDKTDHDMVQVYRWAIYPDSLYEYECSYGCGESYISNKQGKIAEKLDIAKLEAYGRKYATEEYGYDGNPNCNPSTNCGYFPGIQWTIYNMEEGYAFVREEIDRFHQRGGEYSSAGMPVNIDFEPLDDAPNTYIVRVYYSGDLVLDQ